MKKTIYPTGGAFYWLIWKSMPDAVPFVGMYGYNRESDPVFFITHGNENGIPAERFEILKHIPEPKKR